MTLDPRTSQVGEHVVTQKAAETHRLLSILMHSIMDVLLEITENDAIEFVTPSIQKTFGYTEQQIKNTFLSNYIHPEDQHHYATWKNTIMNDSSEPLQLRFLIIDGNYIWIEMHGSKTAELVSKRSVMIVVIREINQLRETQDELIRLAAVAENTDNMVIITDSNRKIEWANQSFLRTTGYTLSEIVGQKPGELLQGFQKGSEVVQYMRDHLESQIGFQVEVLNYKKSGESYWVHADIQPVFSKAGDLTHYIAIESDITNQKTELLRIQTENDILRWIQRMSDIIFFIDRLESVWMQFRDMVIQLLGIQAGIYLIQSGDKWTSQDVFGLEGIKINDFLQNIKEDVKDSIDINQDHYRFIQSSDRLQKNFVDSSMGLVAEFRYDVFLDQQRHSVLYLYYIQPDAVLRPIILPLMEFFRLALQVVTQRELLKNQNEQDPLTLISNRRGLESRMETYFSTKQQSPAVFLLFDLDGFKNLNDSYGHQQGDSALKTIAQYFNLHISANDWIARLGGDEFVLVFHNTTWGQDLMEKLLNLLSESPLPQIGLSLTIGAVSLTEEAKSFQEAYRLADERLYLGKNQGKKRIIGPNSQMFFL